MPDVSMLGINCIFAVLNQNAVYANISNKIPDKEDKNESCVAVSIQLPFNIPTSGNFIMAARINYIYGEVVGNMGVKYIKEEKGVRGPNGVVKRKATFKCPHCGKLFITRISDVRSDKSKSCGCQKGSNAAVYKQGQLINGVEFIEYVGMRNKAQVALFKCPLCGKPWESLVGNIQQGNTKSCGCQQTGGVWTRTKWANYSKNSYLYVVNFYNETESFYKVGIALNVIRRLKYIPYEYTVKRIVYGPSDYIYDLESKFKSIYFKYKYIPLINFKGCTECFNKKLVLWT